MSLMFVAIENQKQFMDGFYALYIKLLLHTAAVQKTIV
jgi:hypothetical protein